MPTEEPAKTVEHDATLAELHAQAARLRTQVEALHERASRFSDGRYSEMREVTRLHLLAIDEVLASLDEERSTVSGQHVTPHTSAGAAGGGGLSQGAHCPTASLDETRA
jgi:hypothetical protein